VPVLEVVSQGLFFACAGGLFLAYPGIYFLSLLVERRRSDWHMDEGHLPSITILLAAYNEERTLPAKLANCLGQDYPPEKLEMVVVSDHSTDRTAEIVSTWPDRRVRLVQYDTRLGKAGIMNRTVPTLGGELTVITDANVVFQPDTLRKLARWFADPRVGLVSGYEQRVQGPATTLKPETWYRDFDMRVKSAEGVVGAAMGAYGGVYAFRTAFWSPLPDAAMNEDLTTTLGFLRRGMATISDPEAVATEEVDTNADQEFGRRTRIGTGNFQCLGWNLWILNPLQGWKSLFFWTHKVPRWFTPHLLAGALLSNGLMALHGRWTGLLVLQVLVYAVGLAGLAANRRGLDWGPLSSLGHFLHMNAAVAVGFVRWLRGQSGGTWTPVR
jgi:cellulose synthase/poly-beta-1,6-N-acetylglucosamine synthase-like glycosyltransferase